jgi:hypothetical protein
MTSKPDREREETSSAASSVAARAWTFTTLIGFLRGEQLDAIHTALCLNPG